MGSEDCADGTRRVAAALESNRAVEYDDGCPDKEYPEVVWYTYGLFDTNEIAVIARCGDLRIGIAAPSTLLHPPMADRTIAIDVSNRESAFLIADQLWSVHSSELISKAFSVWEVGKNA